MEKKERRNVVGDVTRAMMCCYIKCFLLLFTLPTKEATKHVYECQYAPR